MTEGKEDATTECKKQEMFPHEITFMGVWKDNSSRTMKNTFGRTNNIKSAVFRFINELSQTNESVGYFAIQDGNEIYYSFGENNKSFIKFGRIKNDIPNMNWAGKIKQNIGFDGKIHTFGGGWENAVYKIELDKNIYKYIITYDPNDGIFPHKIKFMGIWKDDGNRTMKNTFGRTNDIKSEVIKFMKEMAKTKQYIGYFAIQDGNEIYYSFGCNNNLYANLGRIKGDIPNINWHGKTKQNIGFDGKIHSFGGGWENAVYKIELQFVEITFMGIWKDDKYRTMKNTFGRTKDIKATFSRFIKEMVREQVDCGYFAIQDGNEIYYSFGCNNNQYANLGRIKNDNIPNMDFHGKVNQNIVFDGVIGKIDIFGGGWENAVYQIQIKPLQYKNI